MNLKEALEKVGTIEPVFDAETNAWVFESPHFPMMVIEGQTPEEVIALYPKHLKEHLADLDKGRVADFIVKATPGWGGKRRGAGRPKGSKKDPTRRVTLPADIADALDALGYETVRRLLKKPI